MLKVQSIIGNARFQSKNNQTTQQSYMTKVNAVDLCDTVSFGSKLAEIKPFLKNFKHIFGNLKVKAGKDGSFVSEHLAIDKIRAKFISDYTKSWFKEYNPILEKMTPDNVIPSLQDLIKINAKYCFIPENCPDRIEFKPRDLKTLIGTSDSGPHGRVSDLRISNPNMYKWIADGGLQSIQNLGNCDKPITEGSGNAITIKTLFHAPSIISSDVKFEKTDLGWDPKRIINPKLAGLYRYNK